MQICRKIDYEEGKIATENLLSLPQPPDAILAMNDTLAFAAIEVIKSHGLRIPEDIAIIGYTDEQHANYVEPKLSAVSHKTYKMGETACRLLIDQIKGDRTVRQVIIPTDYQFFFNGDMIVTESFQITVFSFCHNIQMVSSTYESHSFTTGIQ